MNHKNKFLIFSVTALIVSGFFSLVGAQTVGITLPSVPTGLSASVVPPSQVSVSWGAATESSGTIEGYYVYRNGAQIATTGGTSLLDSGLNAGLYIYTVASYDSNGAASAQSAPVSVTVVSDTTPPTTPTGVTITGTTSTNSAYTQVPLTISWGASSDNIGVVGYYVYRNGTQIVSSTTAFNSTSISDTEVPGTYTYTVVAYDAAQNYSNRSTPATITINVDTTAPSTPLHVVAQQISATTANISWASSTDNVGVAGYQVLRNGIQIASTTAPSFSDNGLTAGNTYTYTVTAFDAAGNVSQASVPINVTMQIVNGPSAVYGMAASLVGSSTVNFSWAPDGDNLAISGYAVYRNGAQIATVTSTNYLDMGLASGTYAYSVSATDVSGASSAISSSTNIIVPQYVPFVTGIPAGPTTQTNTSTTTTIAPAMPAQPSTGSVVFNQFLYFGLRSSQVQAMQTLLATNGYLSSAATGYFGSLTLSAVQNFQCKENIVCAGGAGWGTVGPKTRIALNNLESSSVTGTASGQSSASTAALAEEIQALETELMNLEQQVPASNTNL